MPNNYIFSSTAEDALSEKEINIVVVRKTTCKGLIYGMFGRLYRHCIVIVIFMVYLIFSLIMFLLQGIVIP